VIVFVGIFSVLFLHRRLTIREWGGIFLVIGGLAVVGVSDIFAPSTPADSSPASNHTTGQIILGVSSVLQIRCYVVMNNSAFCTGDFELNL
jgi:drug/metabolite transporter (DMT)-like permease